MTLASLRPGLKAKIVRIEGGHECQQRMASLGLYTGTELTVIRGMGARPRIIEARGGRLIIGRGMMDHIFVDPLDSTSTDQ